MRQKTVISWVAVVIGSLLAAATYAGPAADVTLQGAKWVWFPEGDPRVDAPLEARYFRKTFEVPAGAEVKEARLLLAADNVGTAFLNGVKVARCEDFHRVPRVDVTTKLRPGRNVLAVEARNVISNEVKLNPAGMIARLVVELNDRSTVTVASDASWRASKDGPERWQDVGFDDAGWAAAKEVANPGDGPWGTVGPAAPLVIHVPEDFPRFEVPGHEAEMDAIRQLFWHHYEPAGPLIPLWDEWMPMSTLWPARDGAALDAMDRRWAAAFSSRPMNAEGYVLTLQHDGLAHAEGWPFPLWTQGGGKGWHFAGTGIAGYDAPHATPEKWTLTGAVGKDVTGKGWPIELTEARATAQTPSFKVEAKHAPWLRLNWWASGMAGANPYVEWTTAEQPEFGPDRRVYFSPAGGDQAHQYMPMGGGGGKLDTTVGETRTMIPVYRIKGWAGTITGLRINFDNPSPGAQVVIKSFHTAYDSRQSVNNFNFIRGCSEYFAWTGDLAFLRSQLPRCRTAMRYVMSEFDTRRRKCVYNTWPGHEGRSGVRYVDGKKVVIAGEGIGSNYWDLLPFGGEDALATVYYYDSLLKLAALEEQAAAHPAWNIPGGADAFDPADLRSHAAEVKAYGTKRFWNPSTGRFGTVDLDGAMHDYGFTFLNDEAVYYDFATPEQARSIHAWVAGERTVAGDTSTGADIYHWRFGPRSTTRRNVDYYVWCWSAPESVPWGYQVQDGGAVLGWSYHDLMARLKTAGPDDAAGRLNEIAKWFEEVNHEGGYRAYYAADPARGTMQGGNVAGGLGLDREFFESVLVPQVMLYGFLGFRPTAAGIELDPKLPKDWPSLRVTRIHYRDAVLDVTAARDVVTVRWAAAARSPIPLSFPGGHRRGTYQDEAGRGARAVSGVIDTTLGRAATFIPVD